MKAIFGAALLLLIAVFPYSVSAKAPEVKQISGDIYEIYKEDKAGIFGRPDRMKAKIVEQANSFAASKNMAAIPVKATEIPMGPCCAMWASFRYRFRLVSLDDPAVSRVQLNLDSNTIISKPDETGSTNIAITNQASKDIYAELIKLDDLRKRGILTEEEFEREKKKLLDEK